MTSPTTRTRHAVRIALAAGAATALLAGCAGAGGAAKSSSGGTSLNVLMVNNPQMMELQKLAPQFTKETGVHVNFTVLPENDLRDKLSQDFSNQAGQYDVATVSNYEVPFYAKNQWLLPLDPYIAKDKAFDQSDVLAPMRDSLSTGGKVYAEPFYGESSFLMYRKDVFAAKHLTMPAKPTWQQVADLAAKADGAQPGMRGICLRGQPGWGEVIAPLTTMVNTMGGTWFSKDWKAQLTAPEFVNATKFYVNLVRQHGEAGAAESGYAECLNDLTQGKVSMWYDSTAAAGSLEAADSPVKGKIGYVQAPVDKTKSSGWLYSWAWGVQKASRNADNAWKFISWASGKEYPQLVGKHSGWANVPPGTRASLYADPHYRAAAQAFSGVVEESIKSADPINPGVQPRPTMGIQFVDIPEFSDLGTKVSQHISAAIAGHESVDQALSASQALAERTAKGYQH
ncbi:MULTISPECIES: ABC transporter substrate-binding protein [Streptomycetaceae]|uniref:Extracellular solute-binding protein family 1 n=1 Tax=Streptantibioticus cattleyicolor (strain ATCC 35852 / DSM 46488 / JCM 4925 / NBRC 14057 / NRRL 8057) TaxID=1003195 RepID=F8JQT8_STREN|nr:MULTISPECIES: sugar ABC transporter substrate-binding protein [Streptomycetaceae]AEW92820.1 extracellular solute-binding protein family 1 [Streptantibioticus cattleyicolor NRRL 8057 = DSM 46488]MYS57579.1 extracellular solute-binding protein [Streptomyces sp. SID5468]CCB73173.1 putative ABC transporter substrate-binding protein [Streptantibioticus cattleyicolor NRRL 8057 = DSM 46488]